MADFIFSEILEAEIEAECSSYIRRVLNVLFLSKKIKSVPPPPETFLKAI